VVRLLATDALDACGASSGTEEGISVAVLRAAELTTPMAEWLSEILNVGSTLVQIYPPLKRKEEPIRLYCDRQMASDCLVPTRHHIQVLPKPDRSGVERWLLACSGVDLYCTHKPELLTIRASNGPAPLIDWLKGAANACSACEVSEYLREPAEVARFLEETATDQIGARMRSMPVPPSLKHPGRWIRGKAPCLSLTRIELDEEGTVRCCRHSQPIGKMGDARDVLAKRLNDAASQAEQRRGCAECPHVHCPRCPFPGVDDQTYCSIMSQQGQVLAFLNWIHLYSRLPSVLFMQRDKFGGD
jgi:hypothetical protein